MGSAFIDPLTCDFPVGSIPYAEGKDLICQRLKTCLCLTRGESCFFPEAGRDITNPALRQQDAALLTALLRPQVLSVPGITRIVSFDVSFTQTEAIYTIVVQCENGEIINTGGLIDGF